MPPRIDPGTLKKLQPKLRMIADGDTTVNVVRAERCGALAVDDAALLDRIDPQRGPDAAPVTRRALGRKPKTPPLRTITSDVLANVFVYLRDSTADAPPAGTAFTARRGRIVQVQARLSELPALAESAD